MHTVMCYADVSMAFHCSPSDDWSGYLWSFLATQNPFPLAHNTTKFPLESDRPPFQPCGLGGIDPTTAAQVGPDWLKLDVCLHLDGVL